ncbi:phage filamentation protein Fil family protein [Enterobacter soli]|uniref:phage filamentation protein Fil family protein n=1 Tax=Enterobacter soli TaxID=885040 RepID=UPI002F40301F
MLKNEPSFASLLVKPSPAMHCGHGWIIGQDGKRWHPSRSQADLLAGLSSRKKRVSWLLNLYRKLRR